jgi:hypothetical protein
MPRNRNNELVIFDANFDEVKPPNRMVSDFLKNNYWDMLKAQNKSVECAICLEQIDCKKCFCILSCGHFYDIGCIIKCKGKCPTCRN